MSKSHKSDFAEQKRLFSIAGLHCRCLFFFRRQPHVSRDQGCDFSHSHTHRTLLSVSAGKNSPDTTAQAPHHPDCTTEESRYLNSSAWHAPTTHSAATTFLCSTASLTKWMGRKRGRKGKGRADQKPPDKPSKFLLLPNPCGAVPHTAAFKLQKSLESAPGAQERTGRRIKARRMPSLVVQPGPSLHHHRVWRLRRRASVSTPCRPCDLAVSTDSSFLLRRAATILSM